jgi:hypothetical protein
MMRTGNWWVDRKGNTPLWAPLNANNRTIDIDRNQAIFSDKWVNDLYRGEMDVGPADSKIKFVPQVMNLNESPLDVLVKGSSRLYSSCPTAKEGPASLPAKSSLQWAKSGDLWIESRARDRELDDSSHPH